MNLHRNLILIASLVASLPAAETKSSLRMGAAAPAPSITGAAEVGVGSSYIFRGIREADENLEANLELNYRKFYAGVWTMQPFGKREQNKFDWTLGMRSELGRRFVWDLGLVYHTFPGAHHGRYGTRRGLEGQVGLSMAVTNQLAATVYFYHDWHREASTGEGRLTWHQPIKDTPVLLIADLFAGNVNAHNLFPEKPLPRWNEDYSYHGFTLRAEWKLAPRFVLTPGVQYSDHEALRPGNLEGDSWWWFLRLTRTF